jgi:hypothetical protein
MGLAAWCGTANATLLWYDGYTTLPGGDYDTATPLAGQTGGSGTFFTGAGVQHGGDDSFASGTSLTIPGQINPSTGGANGQPGVAYGTARTSRVMTDPWSGFTDPEETFYVGYLVNYGQLQTPDPTQNQAQHRVLEMFNGPDAGDATRVLMFGYSHFAMGSDLMQLNVNGTEVDIDSDPSTVAVEPLSMDDESGGTHFVVLKFEMHVSDGDPMTLGDRDVVSAYVDPNGTTEPALPNAQVIVDDFFADRMDPNAHFVFEFDPARSLQTPLIDELRIASNADGNGFANVANRLVPEPTSLGLLMLASICLVLRGRKRG